VLAENTAGSGLQVVGGAQFGGMTSFARSGTLTIRAHASSATKSHIALSTTSLVFATVQGNVIGVYLQGVTRVIGAHGTFTVHLNKPTPTSLAVGWIAVN
jgi:hypothetical protein